MSSLKSWYATEGTVYMRSGRTRDGRRRLLVGLFLAWVLVIHGLYYWSTIPDYAPEILAQIGVEWPR